MKNTQFVGGILLLAAATLIFIVLDNQASIPVAITLTIVGIALVATSRKRRV